MFDPRRTTAEKVMNRDLLTVHQDAPIEEAMATLEEYGISGAPVVNELGECVGVFSATDVLKRGAELNDGEASSGEDGDYFSFDPLSDADEDYFSKEEYDIEVLGRDRVAAWMSRDVKSILPTTTVEDVCRLMVRERIHRLLVMEGSQLHGLISTFDIVRLIAEPDATA